VGELSKRRKEILLAILLMIFIAISIPTPSLAQPGWAKEDNWAKYECKVKLSYFGQSLKYKIVVKTTITDVTKESFTIETEIEKVETEAGTILEEFIKSLMGSIKGGTETYRFDYYVEPGEAGRFPFYLNPEKSPKEEIVRKVTSGEGKYHR